jgi:hypothetical protein
LAGVGVFCQAPGGAGVLILANDWLKESATGRAGVNHPPGGRGVLFVAGIVGESL